MSWTGSTFCSIFIVAIVVMMVTGDGFAVVVEIGGKGHVE